MNRNKRSEIGFLYDVLNSIGDLTSISVLLLTVRTNFARINFVMPSLLELGYVREVITSYPKSRKYQITEKGIHFKKGIEDLALCDSNLVTAKKFDFITV